MGASSATTNSIRTIWAALPACAVSYAEKNNPVLGNSTSPCLLCSFSQQSVKEGDVLICRQCRGCGHSFANYFCAKCPFWSTSVRHWHCPECRMVPSHPRHLCIRLKRRTHDDLPPTQAYWQPRQRSHRPSIERLCYQRGNWAVNLALISSGSFGKVHSGVDRITGDPVAIKFMRKSDFKTKYLKEAVRSEVPPHH
jgi:hypothetical protein